jgi:hypothetical protein
MAKDLATIEPLALPDHRRPAQMPSLPAWVALRLASLREEQQPDPTGRYRSVMTLPSSLMPTSSQIAAIEQHVGALKPLLEQTPAKHADYEAQTLVHVTKMMMALPGARTSEEGAEATGDAYMAGLDDVPSWAVEAAIRAWYRGESIKVGQDLHDFRWRPAPAVLRVLAKVETWKVAGRIDELLRLTKVEALIEFSAEQSDRGRRAMHGLGLTLKSGEGVPKGLTFEQAIEICDNSGVPLPQREAAE